MIIIPAIDLIDGKCVRLYQGDFEKTTKVANDPVEQLHRFSQDGAKIVHVVDLDGARYGSPKQFDLIQTLCKQAIVPIEVGGGIRNIESVEKYVEMGVSRIVLGTAAIENPEFLKEAVEKFPDQIVVGIDARNGKVATNGWLSTTEMNDVDFAKEIEQLGVKRIIYTDISRDGTMTGPNIDALQKLMDATSIEIIASGGITSEADIKKLSDINIKEAIVGKAIYEGKISLKGVLQ
ncbi:1-(5-phosphoribosyl)-5-[(5-phosphoribosylamino)methylideneamino]imidazole-4-carboxamide isomerase [Heyndrickxia ginsengihumi]|uniref:1-(5-phosphoribosyl)-5-[(5-phosphoribosylamino)methylideneamino] imidazole-4-carboxamide isomerase n=1 Tax=Heyndrickxia ginsengihumi TaxID=363870 RepID=A0A0A6V9E8_9BACI|nr:1-(5-phosphoribosyl)-5-[(5-phosphoribosylamino)methylideneamino]imidazole-4-carboxamide isomerase [Heyndrickxia ginsengihumi]KHD84760.1 1-(5-phosphoribosyl)-5-[(5-phosphoribosylamino)methylideneamino] imidazole-4-carboxamide isomerase [Heyndrickxia ginsengihumi]MBE6185582.1 1-(5-phosphoribosyl)-5-[(5-phosphoribosylamino)methylideneamino]imidazole-4-carboxamide isomerase [Bacillus sp. (in: firmicutes)]MCM3024731.1 1-(5-phosphoribosyl)-5-[(5-phosphoribosylamino)methylideneamino]imidazole-4-carb